MHIVKRLIAAVLTVYVIITISFLLIRFMPGDPLKHLVGEERYYELLDDYPDELERIAARYGLNDSLGKQYLRYLDSVMHFDFGTAYFNKKPVLENVLERAKWTLKLSVPTYLIGGMFGGLLGVFAGWRPGSRYDRIMTGIMLFLNAMPANCIGILFLVFLAFKAKLFPINGMISSGTLTGMARVLDILHHAMLPVIILILFRIAANFLAMKSNVSQVRSEEYIVTAYAKGRSPRQVLTRHVLKNAMLPYTTTLCIQLGSILSGSMTIEVIFGWKGMGQLFYSAVNSRDYPTAQLCFLITAVMVVMGNLLGDIINSIVDPRIRDGFYEY